MKKQATKIAKKVLTVFLCVLISFGSIPLSGFVGLEFPDFPKIDFGFLKASAATKVLSENGEFYISSLNKSNKTASFAGVVDESVSFDGKFYHIPNKTQYNDEVYIITGIDNSAFRKSGIKKVSIHSDITTIGDDAFKDCTSLETVTFEEGGNLKKIGRCAFAGCTLLTDIVLPEKLETIEYSAFEGCASLKNITVPANVTAIGYNIFKNCSSLENVTFEENSKLIHIPQDGFAGTSITDITIPASVETIYSGAFNGLSTLQTVTFEENSKLNTLNDYAVFRGCTGLAEITLPASLETLGGDAFENCTSLKTVTFEEGSNLKIIRRGAFAGCTSLTDIVFTEKLETIENDAFNGCSALTNITIPSNVTAIGYNIFKNCSSLENVIFEENSKLIHIPQDGFAGTSITDITIPASVETIYSGAFNGLSTLQTVTFEENSKLNSLNDYAVFRGCTGLTEITLPASLETLGGDTFRDCTNLKTVTFEEGSNLKIIGRGAFAGCTSLTDIVFTEKLETIEYSAFEGCTSLKNITVPANVTELGRSAFQDCSLLESVVFSEESQLAVIPQYAFMGTKIKNIVIPASVEAMCWGAFENVTSLESVTFEENSKLNSLNDYAVFRGCTGLTEITLPASLETLGDDTFRDCTNLETVTFEEGSNLKIIGRCAFADCTSLTDIVLPEKLETIEYSAFEGCESLEHINLNNTSVTTIEHDAFYGCASLSKVILPETLKSLGEDTFDKCGSIKLYTDTAEPEVLVTIIDEGWPFEIKETGIKDSEERNLKSDNTYYKLSQKLSSGKNGVSLTLKYDFKETVKNNISNCNVSVKVPSTVAFNTATVTVNGVKWSDVSTESQGTVLNIKNVPSSGMIEFKVILTDASYFVSYAKIGYELNNKSYNEVIGIINSVNDMITLNAPSETNKKDITVSGMASPEKNVDLYINGEYCKTVTTSKTGVYSESLILPVSGSTETFNVEARINNGKNISSASVLYSNDAVMITSAKMIYRGQEYDLLANQGKLPVISWSKGASFSFIIKVDNPEAVKAVYVVSQRAGGNNALLCEYNEDLDAYTATGFKGVVPSNLSVRCITKNNSGEYENTIEQLGNEVKEAISESDNVTIVSNDNSTTVTVNENNSLTISIDQNNNMNFSVANNEINENIIITPIDPEYKTEDEIPDEFIRQDGIDKKLFFDRLGENTKVFISNAEGVITSSYELKLSAGEVIFDELLLEFFGNLFDKESGSKASVWLYSKLEELKLPTEIGDTNIDLSTGFALITFIVDSFEYCQKACEGKLEPEDYVEEMLKVAALLPFVFPAAAFGTEVALTLSLVGMVYSIVVSDEFANFLSAVIKFIIDPSGIVYEAVPSNRVEGATVTALWIPYDENVPEFWSEDYPDLSKATVWNAEEYDQINPLKTLDDGSYSWEVPEGWWLVKAEKEGYVTTYSEWMDIPPERFDVNLALVSESAPEVDYINVYENEIEIAFTQYMDIESVNSENISILVNGKTLEGVFNPKNEETSDVDQPSYASVFSFVPESAITGSADINISGVENYCGTMLEGDFHQRNNVVSKIESLSVPETVTAAINSDNSITVSAHPASAAAGKKVFMTLSNNLIVTADCTEITLDENGQGIVNVHAELPGDVTILFTVENTDLTESAVVIVDHSENTVQPEPEPQVFKINWVIDGISNEQFVEAGSEIIRPETPVKDGFAFVGWTPEIPDVMPSYDLTFTAVFEKTYICPDCGNEIRGDDAIREHIATEEKAKIKAIIKIKNNNGPKTINYGETLKLTAVVTDKPADATIVWYVDGVKKGEGETFNVSFESGTKTVEVKLADSNGNILRNASGNEIKDSERVTVKSGFFQKIISFFKNLFGMNRTVVQAIFKGVF